VLRLAGAGLIALGLLSCSREPRVESPTPSPAAAIVATDAPPTAPPTVRQAVEPATPTPFVPQVEPSTTATALATSEQTVAPTPSPQTRPPQMVTSPILDFVFESPLVVPAGSTVTWTNDDIAPHTVTATDGSFDSGGFDPGESYSRVFSEPGRIDLWCTIHPFMVATLIVE